MSKDEPSNLATITHARIEEAELRARETVASMREDEKNVLTHGIMPLPFMIESSEIPVDAIPGAGYIAGIPRLRIPALRETDASLGVAYINGARKDGATAMPSGLAQAASWNPSIVEAGGAMIAAEARAKGFNILLAGGVNLARDPRNGRNFEYFGEDPLLSGKLGGAAIRGIRSMGIISTIKHFALNCQETGRKFADSRISEPAARESDLLAFQIGIEDGQPLSVMGAYNLVNGSPACANDHLINGVLKGDWGFKGFVMSDWGSVYSVDAAINGLDQQSGEQMDAERYFANELSAKAATNPGWSERLDDMNIRILTAIYAAGLDKAEAGTISQINFERNAEVALEAAKQGIVLLKNRDKTLPLDKSLKHIAIIGGYADTGVLSGGGSSQVEGPGGPRAVVPLGGNKPFADGEHYHGTAPVDAIRALAVDAKITYRRGSSVAEATNAAAKADVAIVFATHWNTEGLDQADLLLPWGQNALIAAVAAANPRTIVVLETGNPVAMPWLDDVPAVIEAWYPGARGGDAIASVLFGDTNPSGRLPITFPAHLEQLPRPTLDGFWDVEADMFGSPLVPGTRIKVDYDIEGSDVGYRWFAREGCNPLFPFGHGLSYTDFSVQNLEIQGFEASATVRNTGNRAGAYVAQLYFTGRGEQARHRLAGFARVELEAGEKRRVCIPIEPRILADWTSEGWLMVDADYQFALGTDSENLDNYASVRFERRTWAA